MFGHLELSSKMLFYLTSDLLFSSHFVGGTLCFFGVFHLETLVTVTHLLKLSLHNSHRANSTPTACPLPLLTLLQRSQT